VDAVGVGLTIEDKVRFLSSSTIFGLPNEIVEVIETHMSWVFLVGDRAYKMKKPVRFPFLDFSTLAAREANCRAELALNRRLAPDVYLRVTPLTMNLSGALALDGEGDIVEWIVVMRRLPGEKMLDRMLAIGILQAADVDRLTDLFVQFYRRAPHPPTSPGDYFARLISEEAVNRDVLTRRPFEVDHGRVPAILGRMDNALEAHRELLEGRAAQGRLVDGHGDLKPEHICLEERVVIFDCLEFSAELRLVDPVDELAYLSVECALLGAQWLGLALFERVTPALESQTPHRLFHLHAARRAVLRAGLALAHLLDPVPRVPQKWEPLAGRYLTLAEQALDSLGAI
jgi:aminoglycoside phosphotransferase family enzyme